MISNDKAGKVIFDVMIMHEIKYELNALPIYSGSALIEVIIDFNPDWCDIDETHNNLELARMKIEANCRGIKVDYKDFESIYRLKVLVNSIIASEMGLKDALNYVIQSVKELEEDE